MSYANVPHLRSNAGSLAAGSKPVATAGAGAGTSPTITNAGYSERGQVVVKVGASGEAAGTLVTLALDYSVAPDAVHVSPNDSASAALNPYASATATTLTIGVASAPTASATYTYNYVLVGGA